MPVTDFECLRCTWSLGTHRGPHIIVGWVQGVWRDDTADPNDLRYQQALAMKDREMAYGQEWGA